MKQNQANNVCILLYRIRDYVNDNDLAMALILTRDLYETIATLAKNKETQYCNTGDCK